MPVIGESEKIDSPVFLHRNSIRRGYYTEGKCPHEKYEWAELKSSILMKELTLNNSIQKELVEYIQEIALHIFVSINIDLQDEMTSYINSIKANTDINYKRPPIGQSIAWKGNKKGLWTNFYALYNFLISVWINLYGKGYNNKLNNPIINEQFIIDMFQQQMVIFIGAIRGDRVDIKLGKRTDQIGISALNIDYLKHKIVGHPYYIVDPWLHSGETQCRVPYHGKYGEYMKKYKDSDDYYASLQCGISGSTQFILFLYLISIARTGTDDIDRDIRNTIISACSVLTGDGGHNIREVIFGLTCSIIILHNFIKDLTIELQVEYENVLDLKQNAGFVKKESNILKYKGKLLSYIRTYILDKFRNIAFTDNVYNIAKSIFSFLISSCASWESFIITFYEYTKNINIVGVYKNDLDGFNPSITQDTNKSFKKIKKTIYKKLFSQPHTPELMFSEKLRIDTQIFFSLDNNRYLMDPDESFKHIANDILEKTIKTYPDGGDILEKVNNRLEEQLLHCKLNKEISKEIPFAFSSDKSLRKQKKSINKLNRKTSLRM
jgi:hypothetical protein